MLRMLFDSNFANVATIKNLSMLTKHVILKALPHRACSAVP